MEMNTTGNNRQGNSIKETQLTDVCVRLKIGIYVTVNITKDELVLYKVRFIVFYTSKTWATA